MGQWVAEAGNTRIRLSDPFSFLGDFNPQKNYSVYSGFAVEQCLRLMASNQYAPSVFGDDWREHTKPINIPRRVITHEDVTVDTMDTLTHEELAGIDALEEEANRKEYHVKMSTLYRLRQMSGMRQKNISMPRYDYINFLEDPHIIDYYIKIERFKIAQIRGLKRSGKPWQPGQTIKDIGKEPYQYQYKD